MTEEDAEGGVDTRAEVQALFANLRAALPELRALLDQCGSHWGNEDAVYRFYHQSFKVYAVQRTTEHIVAALMALAPGRPPHPWFTQIVDEGTGKSWEREHNRRWLAVTRPILEAFFHARFFLEMAVHHGSTLETPPKSLPSGWAAFLYLYDLR